MYGTYNEGWVFLAMLYAGIAAGVWYDVLRILRRMLHMGAVCTALMDLLFWAGTLALCVYTLYVTNDGALRLYALCGMALGAGLYAFGISPLVMRLARLCKRLIKKCMDTKVMRAVKKRLSK
nr:spore cortex biosynthesis protein YabQ [Maliibacterium massiliense]